MRSPANDLCPKSAVEFVNLWVKSKFKRYFFFLCRLIIKKNYAPKDGNNELPFAGPVVEH